jgi:hypothetical protein
MVGRHQVNARGFVSEPCGERQTSVFYRPHEPSQGSVDLETGQSNVVWSVQYQTDTPSALVSLSLAIGPTGVLDLGIPKWKYRV